MWTAMFCWEITGPCITYSNSVADKVHALNGDIHGGAYMDCFVLQMFKQPKKLTIPGQFLWCDEVFLVCRGVWKEWCIPVIHLNARTTLHFSKTTSHLHLSVVVMFWLITKCAESILLFSNHLLRLAKVPLSCHQEWVWSVCPAVLSQY